jgi:hypothetical protein
MITQEELQKELTDQRIIDLMGVFDERNDYIIANVIPELSKKLKKMPSNRMMYELSVKHTAEALLDKYDLVPKKQSTILGFEPLPNKTEPENFIGERPLKNMLSDLDVFEQKKLEDIPLMIDEIYRQQMMAEEKLLIDALSKHLNRAATKDDFKLCAMIHKQGVYDRYLFKYDGITLGVIVRYCDGINYKVSFHPEIYNL